MDLNELGNLLGFPVDYMGFSGFLNRIFTWGVNTVFIIYGLNWLMSLLRRAVLNAAGIREV